MSTEDPAAVYVTGEVQTVVVEDEFGQIRVLSVGVQGPAGTGIPSPVGIPDGRVATAVNDLVVWTDLDDRYEEVGAAAQLAATLGSAAFQNSGSFASAAQGVKADSAVQPDDLASVATTGDYDDLINKPTIPTVPVTSVDGEIGDVDLSGNYEEIGAAAALAATLGSAAYQDSTAFASAAQGAKADSAVQPGALAEVATTGSYDDLTDKPSIPSSPVTSVDGQTGVVDLSGAYEEIGAAAALAATLGSAAFANSGSFATAAQGARADSATQPEDLASVATTGDYDDLTNKPTIPSVPVTSVNGEVGDVNLDTFYDQIGAAAALASSLGSAAFLNSGAFASAAQGATADSAVQPDDLASVATSGDYDDLSNKPTIPTVPVTSVDGEIGDVDLSGVYEEIGAAAALAATLGTAAFVNTDTFATAAQGAKADTATQPADLATVATSGDYGDLSNAPDLSGYQATSQKNQPDGYAGLDGDGLLDPGVIPGGGGGGDVTSVDGQTGAVDLSGTYEPIGAAAALAATLSDVATSGAYADLSGLPTLGTAASEDTTAFASAAQGATADTATQPGDLATVATTGDYDDLSGKPTLGTAAATASSSYATAAQGATADTAVQPADIASLVTGSGITNIVAITQTAYDALGSPDPTTLYVITEA